MHSCMYAFLYVCIDVRLCLCTQALVSNLRVYAHIYIYTYKGTYMYICVSVYIYICICVCYMRYLS